jgi:hypothetical protein
MRWNSVLGLAGIAALGIAGLSCSNDSGAPAPVATTIVAVSGNAQTGTAGAPLGAPIMVKVTDQNGAGMASVSVAFAVTAGGGSVPAASVVTDAQGLASSAWTLGATAGINTHSATATVAGLTGSPVTFTASATAGVAAQILKTAGDAQTGEAAQAVGQVPTVTVKDALNNPVPGVTVTWTVTAGGGSVLTATSTTNALGEASMAWTLGPLVGAGAHALQASIPGGINTSFTATGALTAGTLAISGGDNQSTVVNTAVALPPSVLVKTPGVGGVPVAGVVVSWAVTAGGGVAAAGSSTSNAAGVASIGWTVGGTVGANNQGLTATVAGLTGSPVAFVASATAPPTQIALFSGDAQTGTAGQALAQPFVVLVRDGASAPVAGVVVTWQATAGGGTLSAPTSTTDAAGHASATLTVGPTAGAGNQSATAAVTGLAGSPVTFSASVVAAAASQVAVSSGNSQTGTVGTALAQPVAVVVKDGFGNVKSGVTVTWAAAAGSGSTSVASSVTDAAGIATAGWTIGTVAGANNQSATATAAGLTGSPVSFTASATAGPAAVLAIVSGDNQSATVGAALPAPLVVSVKDAFNNPVSGASVGWVAASGGGSVSAATVATSAAGTASVTRTLGSTVGSQTTTASVAGTTPASVTFNSTGTAVTSQYSITLRYLTAISPARQAVFDAAAARWGSIITGDVTDIPINTAAGAFCSGTSPAINEVIDDILIFVTLDSIDGPGMTLGSAGPCAVRSGTKLSIIGSMTFDTADVAFLETNGIFQAVMLHEMGHVIGIGTLWNFSTTPALLVGAGGADPFFTGATAISEFDNDGGAGYAGPKVPVENTGGAGTRDGHWRESVMGRELMTGFVSLTANPLSTITVGSLADMGYTVSLVNADPYTVSPVNIRLPGGGPDFQLREVPPDWPLMSVDAQGRLTRVR